MSTNIKISIISLFFILLMPDACPEAILDNKPVRLDTIEAVQRVLRCASNNCLHRLRHFENLDNMIMKCWIEKMSNDKEFPLVAQIDTRMGNILDQIPQVKGLFLKKGQSIVVVQFLSRGLMKAYTYTFYCDPFTGDVIGISLEFV